MSVQKGKYVLEFGHLSKDKGTETLLKVAKRMPETKFVFIGYGPSSEKMRNIENVEYLGFKKGDELYRIISEASISVCPSEMYENCPFSVIEDVYKRQIIGKVKNKAGNRCLEKSEKRKNEKG